MNKKFYVYIHYTKNGDKPFYIGKGSGNRAFSIYKRNKFWKNIVNKYDFYVDILESNLSEFDALELEMYWISQFKNWGFELTNMTDGGDGIKKGFKHSEKTKKKMSESKLGKPNFKLRGRQSNNKGLKMSEEQKKKLSLACMGRTSGYKGKLGRKHTVEELKKMSESHKGKKHSEETKEKIRLFRLGKKKTNGKYI